MKKLIVAICIAFVAAGAAFSVKSVVNNSKENSFIKRNVEALSRTEEDGCTGPKVMKWFMVYCECTNESSCLDNYNCD